MSKGLFQGIGRNVVVSELDRLEKSGNYVAERKFDGIWCSCVSDGRRNVFESRNGLAKATGLQRVRLPEMVIIGELGFGQEEATKRREEIGHDFMDVFDVTSVMGTDVSHLPLARRRRILEGIWKKLPSELTEHYILAEQWNDHFEERYRDIVAKGGEGIVLKDISSSRGYIPGTRTDEWMRCKKHFPVDMVIMGAEVSSAASYAGRGMAKNLLCGVYNAGRLVRTVKVGGMSDAWRLEFGRNIAEYVGQVAEIHCWKVFKTGSLRHPNFSRIRDDKDADECTIESLIEADRKAG